MEFQLPCFTFIFTVALIFIAIVLLFKNSVDDDTVCLPPGPTKLPLIGNIHQLLSALPHVRLCELAKKYGPLMHLKMGEICHVIVSSPEMAKQVMKIHDINFATRPYQLPADILFYNSSNIVNAPYGEYWRQLKKILVVELLSVRRVKMMKHVRESQMKDFIKSIEGKSKINLREMLMTLQYGIITETSLGHLNYDDHQAFIHLLDEINEVFAAFRVSDMYPSIKILRVLSGLKPRLERMHRELDKILEDIVAQHRAKSGDSNESRNDLHDDFLDVLLKLQQDGDFQLTTDNIKALILDIVLAGSESSSNALEWGMCELLKKPSVMEKAQAEVRRVFDRKGCVDEEGLEELKYFKLVVKEIMRLHPAAPLLVPRECTEKCKINGYDIPVKTRIIINVWALARDPDYWSEPESFYPERFLNSSVDFKGANFEFLPFGAGRRICPGISFGVANIEHALANMLYHFDWKLPDNMEPDDLDMTEVFAVAVRRKTPLYLIPIPYHPAREAFFKDP